MGHKSEKVSIVGLIAVLFTIAISVAGIVYGWSTHRRHLNDEKWKDYDECGLS